MDIKKELLRILKNVLYIAALVAVVGLIYHWARGIYCSCVADDVITAQNREAASYHFIYMICAGLVVCATLFPTIAIKVPACPEKLMAIYKGWWDKFASLFRRKETKTE